jgi:ribose transport system ATP-binding protein
MREIVRALRAEPRILIMDEPTSSLSEAEAERLFAVVRNLRQRGVGVIYISHRLAEVHVLADRVVVLRDGRNAGELPRADIDHDRMVALMVGRTLRWRRREAHAPGDEVLEVRGLRTLVNPRAGVDFTVRRREVVGIAGLLGAGRTEVLQALFGVGPALAGTVRVHGRELPLHDPRAAVAAGLALAPEDRKAQGLVLEMNVRENLSLPTLHRRGFFVDRAYESELCARSIQDLNIATPHGEQLARNLSGGNQQKIVLGKWLAASPSVLLLDEPTRGIDVGARQEIYARIHALADQGLAVIFVSSELEEVLALADRVLVMHEGRLAGELAGAAISEQAIMQLATGMGAP